MKRRDFLATAGVAGAVGVAAGVAISRSTGPGRGDDTDGPSVEETSLSTPALNPDRVPVALVSTWPRDFPGLGTGAQRFAERLSTLSDGRFQVEYFAAGERVGAFDSFDAVASGDAQGYHGAEYYWKGRHPGWAYFTAVPFGLTYTEQNAWIRFGGGQELWDELAGEFGLKGLMCGNTGVQMGGWFNKEINSADDLAGLKMRIPGLGGDVMAKLGASPVSLPGGQIYENLISGAIDATEWVGPWNDEIMKFYEATQYYYFPGFHEPGAALAATFNASWWSGLSATDKALIEAAAATENDVMMSEYNAKNGAALARLINDQGVEVRKFTNDTYDAFGAASDEVFAEVQEHSDLAARIHASFLKGRQDIGGWTSLSDQAYVEQRNRVLGV